LDIGCRGFVFAKYFADNGFKVIACDPDTNIQNPNYQNIIYKQIGIIGSDKKVCTYAGWSTGEGNYITDKKPAHAANFYEIPCFTIKDLMLQFGIPEFEIIKMDCEGSEYDILMNMDNQCCKQISVEFHDFLGLNPCYPNNEEYYSKLKIKLNNFDFVIHKHTPMVKHNPLMNYWDSLFIRK
jgi:FkbM family methyltransferase